MSQNRKPKLRGAIVGGADTESHVGMRLHAYRQAADLTVAKLAMKAGVSTGVVSQIERGKTNPSLRMLHKLCTALGITISDLIEPETAPSFSSATSVSAPDADMGSEDFVRRFNERPTLNVGSQLLIKKILSSRNAQRLRFMTIRFPPNALADDVLRLPGEKAGLVLHGRFRLSVDGREATVSEGDSFQFDSTLPHWIRNESDEDAELLWIISSVNIETII